MAQKLRVFADNRINLAATNDYVQFDVAEFSKCAVSARYDTPTGSAWATAVIDVEKSLDGKVWAAQSAQLTAEGVTADIDISTAQFVRARVSTAQSNAGYAYITLAGLVSVDQ